MILIDSLYINDTSDELVVEVTTEVGNTFTQVLVWNSETYKQVALAIDVSSLLTSTGNTESFSITAADLGLTSIVGLWFVEFTTDEVFLPTDCCQDNTRVGVTFNFINYNKCIIDGLLKMKFDGCHAINLDGCSECGPNVLYLSTLLDTLEKSIIYGFYEKAIEMIAIMDEMCDTCGTCPTYDYTQLKNNGGFGTFDNQLRLS